MGPYVSILNTKIMIFHICHPQELYIYQPTTLKLPLYSSNKFGLFHVGPCDPLSCCLQSEGGVDDRDAHARQRPGIDGARLLKLGCPRKGHISSLIYQHLWECVSGLGESIWLHGITETCMNFRIECGIQLAHELPS